MQPRDMYETLAAPIESARLRTLLRKQPPWSALSGQCRGSSARINGGALCWRGVAHLGKHRAPRVLRGAHATD
jgi:hypothetical protein